MQLTDADEAAAVATLQACGIEGNDLRTGLDVVCRLSTADGFEAFLADARERSLEDLTDQYGHDAVRHVAVLRRWFGVKP